MKKEYFIHRGGFANSYSLVWADGTMEQPKEENGLERITRKEAIAYCIRERARRKWEPYSAGYATDKIWPYDFYEQANYLDEYDSRLYLNGSYIMDRAR